MGLIIPAMLSIGNVYRSVAWPDDVKPMVLASGTLLASAFTLALVASLTDTPIFPKGTGSDLIGIVVLQGLLTALTYLCAFELQRRSDPVFYSQLGAVAAVFGLLIGVFWFEEHYSVTIWLGAFLAILGLRISNRKKAQTSVAQAEPVR